MFYESVWAIIYLEHGDTLQIDYFNRSSSSSDKNNNNLMRLILEASYSHDSHHRIIGDFNFPGINWDNWSSAKNEHHDSSKFIDCFMNCYLYKHIADQISIREGRNSNTIDLVFTRDEHMIKILEIEPPLENSDHVELFFKNLCTTSNIHRSEYDVQWNNVTIIA